MPGKRRVVWHVRGAALALVVLRASGVLAAWVVNERGECESVIWLGTGLTDTATGGYFEMAPDEATCLGVEPVRPTFIAAAPRPPRESGDRCGRRTGPDAR